MGRRKGRAAPVIYQSDLADGRVRLQREFYSLAGRGFILCDDGGQGLREALFGHAGAAVISVLNCSQRMDLRSLSRSEETQALGAEQEARRLGVNTGSLLGVGLGGGKGKPAKHEGTKMAEKRI